MIEELELMVDEISLAGVLEALEQICREKAEHLRVNWQDDEQARGWEKNAKCLAKAGKGCIF